MSNNFKCAIVTFKFNKLWHCVKIEVFWSLLKKTTFSLWNHGLYLLKLDKICQAYIKKDTTEHTQLQSSK